MKFIRGVLFTLMLASSVSFAFAQQPSAGSLRGQVKDALDALIVGATVKLVDANGHERTVVTDEQGGYFFNNLTPGAYTVSASAEGFSVYEKTGVVINTGRSTTLDINLNITLGQEEVTVSPEGRLSTDTENNANAIVLRGKDLEALPEDPDDLVASLQAMAGPSAGFFGQSTTTVGGFGVGGNSAAGNRRIQFQARFTF